MEQGGGREVEAAGGAPRGTVGLRGQPLPGPGRRTVPAPVAEGRQSRTSQRWVIVGLQIVTMLDSQSLITCQRWVILGQ